MVSGTVWFIFIIILNKKAFPDASFYSLIKLRDISLYLGTIRSETDMKKINQLKVLAVLVVVLTVNFFFQLIIGLFQLV